MLVALRSSAAFAAIAVALAACSPASTEASPEAAAAPAAPAPTEVAEAAAPATTEAAAPEADQTVADLAVAAQPAALPATAPAAQPAARPAAAPATTNHAGMDHAKPAAAPAPAPEAAPEEQQASAFQPPGVTNHNLPIAKIKNFKLTDHTGKEHELYKMTDAKAIILTMHTKGCPIGQQLMPDFKELQAKYEPKGVKFLMLNSNTYDTPKMIAEEITNFKSTIPVLKDTDQSVGEPLGVERATETLVIQPGTWKILYQGPISDRVTYGRARAKADKHYVASVMDAMLAGQSVTPSYVAPEGCILVFDKRQG